MINIHVIHDLHENRWLTREELINGKWMFFNDNGYLGEMAFLEDGTIGKYDNRNERTWELRTIAHGYTILEIYGQGHKQTCAFISSILDATGKWKLQGPFTSNKSWRHYLVQYD